MWILKQNFMKMLIGVKYTLKVNEIFVQRIEKCLTKIHYSQES